MKPSLSIIMPCYNCSATLEEAVESCFIQNLENFELVMVDDCSTDNTVEIMKSLSKKHKEIKLVFHESNRGGGGTRNTAIANTSGDIIFCLDSDDALPENTLSKMLEKLTNENLDGVVFSGSYVFSKDRNKAEKKDFNLPLDRELTIEDVFSGKPWGVGANFMYKKQAYLESGKYPNHHHFDTQSFGIRFLSTGHKAKTCPDSYFYQRQQHSNYSYFERVYNSGEFSIGFYLVLREISHLFTTEAKDKILNFDTFPKKGISILALADNIYKENKLFSADYKKYLTPLGRQKYLSEIGQNKDVPVKAINYFLENKYKEAIESYKEIINNYKNIKFECALAELRLSSPYAKIGELKGKIPEFNPQIYTKKLKRLNIFERIINKIIRELK